MKKLFITIMVMVLTVASYAQTKNLLPEFNGQIVAVNADSTTVLLLKETTKLKTGSTSFGFIPIPGAGLLDKYKTRIVVNGRESQTTLKSGRLTFLVKTEDNNVDPSTVFAVMKFDVKKKAREILWSEMSVIGGANHKTNIENVQYKVNKYGNNAYLVVIENAEPGQYAFMSKDISYVLTFGVK